MSSLSVSDRGLAKAAARLRWAVLVVVVLMAAVYCAARFGWQLGPAHVEYRSHPGAGESARLIGDGTMLLLLVALFQLTRMLGRIAAGELFSAAVIRSFRSFASWLLLMALWGLLAPIAAGLLLRTPGSHLLRLTLDFREVLTVGITLLLFLIARLLEHARHLDEEVREFV